MSFYRKMKQRMYEILGPAKRGDISSILFDIFICVLVVLSSAAVIAELIGVPAQVEHALLIFEYVTVGVFIVEYLLRLWTSDLMYPECRHKFAAMWEYIGSFDSLIDLISILSIFMNGIPKEFAMLRLIKLVKLARLVKISDHVRTSGKFHSVMVKLQRRTNEIIDKAEHGDKLSKIFDITLTSLIFLSVSFIFVETFPLTPAAHRFLEISEIVIACIFVFEYILRVWTAPLDYPELRPDKARMKYIFSFLSLIDLLSIVPIFVTDLPTTAGILKLFKLCKILRLVKASRYLSGIANFGIAIKKKKKQIILSFVSIIIMILICSTLMYSFEHDAQPGKFEHGLSGVMYCVMVLVENEPEIAPITTMGKTLSTIMLLLGGCMFGVPIAFVATGFEDMVAEQAGEKEEDEEENKKRDAYDLLRDWDMMSDEDRATFTRLIGTSSPDGK